MLNWWGLQRGMAETKNALAENNAEDLVETVLLKFCSKISSSFVSFLPPAMLNELARKKKVVGED